MTIANIMKTTRESKNLKVKDIASHVGVAESTYRDWENGRSIQGEPYFAIAEALQITLGELLGINQKEVTQNFLREIEKLQASVNSIKVNATRVY